MENGKSNKRELFLKLDSTVLLERHDECPTSSQVYIRQHTAGPNSPDVEFGSSAATPVGLELSIRIGRVVVLMIFAVTALVSVTLWLQKGVTLGHYDPAGMDTAAQQKLVDDSYTGNVASVFSKPLEIFVALAVQVVVLRLMTASLLSTEVGWKTDAFTLALTAGVGYLLANGLNSLNVQPQKPTIETVISTSDLAFVSDTAMSDAALRTTNISQTFSERSPKNPITNTVLRNLVLQRVPAKKPFCDQTNRYDARYSFPDVVLEYGFSQRDWQSRLLQEVLEPKQLRVIVNPSNKTAKQPTNLPMKASLAADLFVHSMAIAPYYFQWGRLSRYFTESNITGKVDSVARILGLMPPLSSALDETAQRDWFLRESTKAVSQVLQDAQNLSRSDIGMEFSHVDISPTIRFDAVTIDFEVNPMQVAEARTKDNMTRFNSINPNMQCGPWPLRCAVPNPVTDVTKIHAPFGTYAQVQVFGTCVSDDGTEQLSFANESSLSWGVSSFLQCASFSNSSFMVMSIAKRFVADAVVQGKTANSSGVFDTTFAESGFVQNMRRIYSFTLGKLSWQLADLAIDYNASRCVTPSGSCMGLRFPLDSPSADSSQQQELIVGVDALPTNLMTPLLLIPDTNVGTRFLPLVQLRESMPPADFEFGLIPLAAEPLLPHNGGNVSWNMQAPPLSYCERMNEDRIQVVMNNHMYIEHGLQTAYTAATFFLLQNGVVKNVIKLDGDKQTLDFQQNKQTIALKASIPIQNAWLTLGGCAVLVIGLCSAMLWACVKSRTGTGYGALGQVTTPHVVARVMLDPARYPPAVLNRRVVGGSPHDSFGDEINKLASVDGFIIDGLGLQPPPREQKLKKLDPARE